MTVFAVAEDEPCRLPDLERELGRNHPVGPTANAVGAEIATNHGYASQSSTRTPRLPPEPQNLACYARRSAPVALLAGITVRIGTRMILYTTFKALLDVQNLCVNVTDTCLTTSISDR